MNEIISKRQLSETIWLYVVQSKEVSRNARAGQFVVIRPYADSERIPLTLCDFDASRETITLMVQTVGLTTKELSTLNVGDSIADVVGPLGKETELDMFDNIALVAGGVGIAVVYPQAKRLLSLGKKVTVLLGARNKDLLVFADELNKLERAEVKYCTDDGSFGLKGNVVTLLTQTVEEKHFDALFVAGPVIMMKFVAEFCKKINLRAVASLNPIMIDGTGMCGGCRVLVGGVVKYACVEGPDFDASLVDFSDLMNRNAFYREQEQHKCNLFSVEGKSNG